MKYLTPGRIILLGRYLHFNIYEMSAFPFKQSVLQWKCIIYLSLRTLLLMYCLKVKADVNLKLLSCDSVKSKRKHKLKKQREIFHHLDNHRLMVRKTHVTIYCLLGFSFMAEFSPLLFFHLFYPYHSLGISPGVLLFSCSLLGHFFLLDDWYAFQIFMSFLLCREVKKFTFSWTDRDGS